MSYGFEGGPESWGQHLRKLRIDSGRTQRDIAKAIGVTVATLGNWEFGRSKPHTRFVPRLLKLLGFDPRPKPITPSEKLIHWRDSYSLTQEALAAMFGVNESSVSAWITGRHRMSPRSIRRLGKLLAKTWTADISK